MSDKQTRRNVTYNKDNGEEVSIQILYFNNAPISPDVRFTAGGFGAENKQCSINTPRRFLKPRIVTFRITQDDKFKYIEVICKTNQIAMDFVNGGGVGIEANLNPVAVSYQGESFTVC